MQRPHNTFISIIQAVTCALLALGAVPQARAADASGTWSWSIAARNNRPERKFTLKLKQDGDKLTGTLSTPGRQGQANETAIGDGQVKANEVSFTVTREFNNNKFVSKYAGKVTGDTIKGTIETERGGNTRSRPWEAKREEAK
jgi:hypothetical protein